ncbi:toxin-antitoxin system YwqK family antitoxin [bacterium]|nr:toxin-antitoxin system YwqK family antitoxin [bacterium]
MPFYFSVRISNILKRVLSMKSLFIIPLVLLSLVSSSSWALSIDDLVGNDADGLTYQKFTSTPFTGKLNEGLQRGSFKNGKKEGSWEEYRENGLLFKKGTYKNGKKEGSWEEYRENGLLFKKGTYKNGKKEGSWEEYPLKYGVPDPFGDYKAKYQLMTYKGDYKNGKKEGSWEKYRENGKLLDKGDYKNGKKEGYWEYYNQDGSLEKNRTGTYKNGVKVSD